jgi:outer membrane protein assembly factor BamB/TolA-binding protein
VLITTVCPFCEQPWRVDDSLRGRQLRCPNASCRQVFEVREQGPPPEPPPEPPIEGVPVPPAPPTPPKQKTGQVGDMVPVVSAEAVPPPPPAPDWRTAPPPPRAGGASSEAPTTVETPPTRRAQTPPPAREQHTPPPRKKRKPADEHRSRTAGRSGEERRETVEVPVELPPGTWDAPPVRGGGTVATTRGRSRTALEMEAAEKRAQAKKHRAKVAMLAITGTVLIVLLLGGGLVMLYLQGREARDRDAADELYAQGQFVKAEDAFRKLVDKYPDSPNVEDYKFWRDLCEIRAMPSMSSSRGAFDTISTFLAKYKDDPRLAEHGKEIGDVIVALLERAGNVALANPEDIEAQNEYHRGLKLLDDLLALNREWVAQADVDKAREVDQRVKAQIERGNARLAFVARVRGLLEQPPLEGLRQLAALVRQEVVKGTNFDKESVVKEVEDQLQEKHRNSIVFTQEEEPLPARPVAEDVGQSLLVQPVLTTGDVGPALPPDRVIFALARGVLYGLRQDTGDIVWAMRVGIDTHNLPLRVPPAPNRPELALVLSADTLTLTAVKTIDGATWWRHRLGAANLGRPVIVENKVYVPTLGGDVEEIELDGGRLVGRYKLGQSLSVGGTYCTYVVNGKQVKQVFFPGDDSCVYVLDVNDRRCQAVLYTDHAAGTLRGEPILLPSEDNPDVPGYLVLCEAHGLDATMLRTFQLLPGPKEGQLRVEADPLKMPDRRLRGQPWFPPFRDPEKLVTVTDAGVLGLFGIKQLRNQDPQLFPMVRLAGQEEGTFELTGQGAARGRAQVVFGRGEDLWVLARGRLQRYLLTLDPKDGPRVTPGWTQARDLGSPLHESQLDDDETTLFLVTLSPSGQVCLATAVDTETGQVRWQRQLGLVCHGDPRQLGDQVVALDQGGGLFGFRASKHLEDADWQWQSAGHVLAPPLPEGSTGPVYYVAGPDGQSVFQFTCPDPGNVVTVRQFRADRGQAEEYKVANLPAPLAGTPAVGANRILMPLANGDTRQVRLAGKEATSKDGPKWRATRGDTGARGHVVWLGGDDFLTTNGRRGLTRWRFDASDLYGGVPAGSEASKPTLALPEDIAGVPLVLARAGEGPAPRVCVADDRGTVYLYEGDELKLTRRWALKEPLTAGPFLRGGLAGCVVGRRTLVWLDPAQDKPLWQYESPGEGIIGQPQVVDSMVLVADVTGHFVGLDAATGRPRGPGYQLRASVGPAAAPAAFSAGRAFAPLTDGTVLLLSLRHLREPLPGLPPVW